MSFTFIQDVFKPSGPGELSFLVSGTASGVIVDPDNLSAGATGVYLEQLMSSEGSCARYIRIQRPDMSSGLSVSELAAFAHGENFESLSNISNNFHTCLSRLHCDPNYRGQCCRVIVQQ